MQTLTRDFVSRGLQKIMASKISCATFLGAGLAWFIWDGIPSAYAQTPVTVGYRDFNFGSTVISTPTAEKPESKLWWNDGLWWGVLWNPRANKYRIHRFDLATQSWVNVGPDVDDRSQSLSDALWDGQKLYIASHVYGDGSQTSGDASAANAARVYRYSYDPAADTYSLDAGFPVLVNSAICEALVLDKDSLGRLWVTWTQSDKVYLNHSLNNDLTWGTPFALPTQGSNLNSDDISTLIPYNGKIGVAWSNQSDTKIYFSFHQDNKADADWEPREVALSAPWGDAIADDHLNIKMTSDGGGNLFVATKTSLSSGPGIYLLKRSFAGGWTNYVVATHSDNYTRPVVVIDDENRELYVIGKSGSFIHKKKVSLDDISFPSGAGDPFIQTSGSADINNATVSKHNVNSTTGLLMLASDEVNRYYYHNYIALTGSSGTPTISTFSPTSGPVGTPVNITGTNFSGATGVAFDGTAASFSVNSNAQITATVPAGATTGKIRVTKSTISAVSANNFTVTTPVQQYTLTVNTIGSGTVNPASGTYNSGASVTLTATPVVGHQFSSWSGDLTGTANPVTIAMDTNKNITATFTESSSGGQVAHQETVTGSSTTTTAVSANLTGVSGHLYLAAISAENRVAVATVSGLGLNWTLVKAQCSGRNKTAIEIWMAQGTPSDNGAVAATFVAFPKNAVIAVSRYSNVDAANPIGNLVSGNTTGVNGDCSDGSDTKTYSFNLTTTANGALVYGAATLHNRSHTPGAEYIERADLRKSNAAVAVEDKSLALAAATTINGTFSGNVDWAFVGLEIKPPSRGGATQYTLTTNVVGSGSVSPSGGTYNAGAMVTLTATPAAGFHFSGWSGALNGATNPATLTMDANKNVTATFTAVPPTQYSLTVNIIGSGNVTLNPSGAVYNAGTAVTLTATPNSGYQFSDWSGDLSGSVNPAKITMNADKNVTVYFTTSGSGQVVYEETKTGGSSNSVTVTTSKDLAGVSDHLYLAAISTIDNAAVIGVSGLGLSWTLVKAQCTGRENIGVEVWMAQGTPSGNGAVTAKLATRSRNAVIAVSRYSGVNTVNPLGNILSGNTNGVDGACSGGKHYKSYSFKLATTANCAMVYGAAAMRDRNYIPGVGYIERAEIKNGSASVAVQDKSFAEAGAAILNGTFSGNTDWAVVGLELEASITAIGDPKTANSLQVKSYQLEQNYPNPFSANGTFGNPGTSIRYSLRQAGEVHLTIYNIHGQTVSVPVKSFQNAGTYTFNWQAMDAQGQALPSGVYFYRLEAGSNVVTRRMTLLR